MEQCTEKQARLDSLPGCNYKIWQTKNEFCYTTDAVFLAAFSTLSTRSRVLELGAGTGAVSLLLAARGADSIVGVDCNSVVTELFRQSIAENKLSERITALLGDVRRAGAWAHAEAFDLVVANPPYRTGGKRRQVGTNACHEVTGSLEDFFRAAAFAVKYRGRFALVQLPERFTECLSLAAACNLELKRLRWLHADANKTAWAFLAEFVKGGSPGLTVESPLFMYNADGTYTEDTLKAYRFSKEEDS